MKILFLAARFYPDIGGVEKHVLEISEELLKRGHQITIVTELRADYQHNKKNIYQSIGKSDIRSNNSKQPVKSTQTIILEFKGMRILRMNFGESNWLKKFRIWGKLLENYNLFKDADIIHCHDVFFWYMPLRFLFPNKKVFTTFHGYETKFPISLKAKFIRKISEVLSHGNICVGEFIEKWYGTKATYVTYGGVSAKIKNYKPKLKDKKKLYILFMGRLEKDTGVMSYIKTVALLGKKGIKVSLTAIGEGSLKNHVKKYGHAIGSVLDTAKYINDADVVFASSYLSIIESLVYKKPVYAVYENELKKDYLEMSPMSEFISISGSEVGLVGALLRPAGEVRVKDGYRWAREQTWDKVTDTYLKLWK